MANQQLVDYISAQRGKGVARDAINAALLGAGWNQADVAQAMGVAFGASATPATVAPASSPVASVAAVSPVSSVAASPVGGMGATTPFFKPIASAQPAMQPATQPATQPASQPVRTSGPVSFQPAASSTTPFSKPATSSPMSAASPNSSPVTVGPATTFNPASVTVENSHHVSKPLVAAVIVVVLLVIGGLSYWYFGSASSLIPTPGAATPAGPTQAQVDTLTQENTVLTTKATELNAQIATLKNELSLFQPSTSTWLTLTIGGTLQQTAAKQFTLTTDDNILVTVSNSKDAKVVSTLTPLIGTKVTLTGTHAPLSTQLKITAVNNASLEAVTSTPGTSTSSATSTQ